MENITPALLRPPGMSRPLCVAVVTETYPPEINGVALTVRHMIDGLRQRNHAIQLIRPRQETDGIPPESPGLQQFLQRGLPIPRYRNLQMGLPAGAELKRIWNMARPDVVHIATEGPLGWSALNVASKLKIPVITDFHTNFHSYSPHYGIGWLKQPINLYLRHFHNRALMTLVPDEGLRYSLAGQGYRNLAVIGRGVDIDLFNPARRNLELRRSWGASWHDLVVIHVGRLAPEKNLAAVVDAFDAIRARHPNAKLVWVGDGSQRQMLQARHPDHIFAGMRTGVDLAEHYASADIFLFPSLTETFGNVTLEAMASGLAVVAYNYAAAAENIRHKENGLVVKSGDLAQFREQAASLATQPEVVAHLGRNARQRAQSLSWRRICERFERLLLDVVDEKRQHARPDRFMPGESATLMSSSLMNPSKPSLK